MFQLVAALVTIAGLAGLVFAATRLPLAMAQKIWVGAFVIVIGGAVTMTVAHSFIAKWAFKGDSPRDGLTHLMDGTAYRPFVYRRLAPDIVRVATDFSVTHLPPTTLDYLERRSPLRKYTWEFDPDEWNQRKAVLFHVAYTFTWLSWFGTFIAGAFLYREALGRRWLESLLVSSVTMCLVPLMLVGGGYIYDAPELLLWTTLLCCALQTRLWALPPLFALMLVNKESALLAVPCLFPLLERRVGRRAAARWTGGLAAMGVAWVCFVRARFAGAPGDPVEWHLLDNLVFWARPGTYFSFSSQSSPALPSPRGANLFTLCLLLLPIRFGWPIVDRDIRWATVIVLACLVPMFLVGGSRDEVRALALSYPFLLLIALTGVHEMFKQQSSPVSTRANVAE